MQTRPEIQTLALTHENLNHVIKEDSKTVKKRSEISSLSSSSHQLELDLSFFEDTLFFENLIKNEHEKMHAMPKNHNFFSQDFTHPDQNQHHQNEEKDCCCGITSQLFLSIKKGT
jgi:hypothetical protein